MKTKEEPKIVTFEERVRQHALDLIENCLGKAGNEVHQILFNDDYFVIGYYEAEQMLIPYGIFTAIEKIQDYEKSNFGEVTTDLGSSEKVANMLAYILGEELLAECPTIQDKWDDALTEEDLKAITNEIKAWK